MRIPDELAAKANGFPESSYGATTVTLILSDGTWIRDVVLGGASDIVKVRGRHVSDAGELGFSISEIVDVVPNDRPLRLLIAAAAHWARRLSRSKR